MSNTPTPTELPSPSTADASLLLAFTRLEAKVDVALTQHGADLKNHAEDLKDHEARLRILEGRSTVSPRTLWTVVAAGAGLVISAVSLIQQILG